MAEVNNQLLHEKSYMFNLFFFFFIENIIKNMTFMRLCQILQRELTRSYEARIKQLQKDLSSSKGEVSRVEANMVEALSAKNAEIEALVSSVDGLKKQAALSEGNLATLQVS